MQHTSMQHTSIQHTSIQYRYVGILYCFWRERCPKTRSLVPLASKGVRLDKISTLLERQTLLEHIILISRAGSGPTFNRMSEPRSLERASLDAQSKLLQLQCACLESVEVLVCHVKIPFRLLGHVGAQRHCQDPTRILKGMPCWSSPNNN